MENLALEMINDVVGQEQEGFVVRDDKAAEWAIKKIAEEKRELQRTTMIIDSMIAEYELKKRQADKVFEDSTAWLKNQLMNYFETVEKKKTKTQATYKLPSGTLKMKFGGQEFKREKEALVQWLKDSGKKELIKTEESPDWAALKKEVNVVNGKVVTEDGEIVAGVVVVDKPDTFEIDF